MVQIKRHVRPQVHFHCDDVAFYSIFWSLRRIKDHEPAVCIRFVLESLDKN